MTVPFHSVGCRCRWCAPHRVETDALRIAELEKLVEQLKADACQPCLVLAARLNRVEAERNEREPSVAEMQAEWDSGRRAPGQPDTAFLGGTVRRCIDCRSFVFGGPTRCLPCAVTGDLRTQLAQAQAEAAALRAVAEDVLYGRGDSDMRERKARAALSADAETDPVRKAAQRVCDVALAWPARASEAGPEVASLELSQATDRLRAVLERGKQCPTDR